MHSQLGRDFLMLLHDLLGYDPSDGVLNVVHDRRGRVDVVVALAPKDPCPNQQRVPSVPTCTSNICVRVVTNH